MSISTKLTISIESKVGLNKLNIKKRRRNLQKKKVATMLLDLLFQTAKMILMAISSNVETTRSVLFIVQRSTKSKTV
jgi:hypothetical protein